MKTFKLVLLLFVLLTISFWTLAQESPYFVLNGQSCEDGYYSLDAAHIASGQPLQLRLAGVVPPSSALDFFLTYRGKKKGLQTLNLEFRGYTVGLTGDRLRVSSQQVAALFGNTFLLRLHLGDLNTSNSGILSIHASRAGSAEDYARLDINLEGLRVPGEELPWSNNMASLQQLPVPIYPNPVREGPIFLDLQNYPSAATGVVSVTDLLGSRLYRAALTGGGVHQISSDRFPKGIYFLRIEMNGATVQTTRLIIEK